MAEEKEIKGEFVYQKDSLRFHKFEIRTAVGLVGTIYVPKDSKQMPKRIVLDYSKGLREEW